MKRVWPIPTLPIRDVLDQVLPVMPSLESVHHESIIHFCPYALFGTTGQADISLVEDEVRIFLFRFSYPGTQDCGLRLFLLDSVLDAHEYGRCSSTCPSSTTPSFTSVCLIGRPPKMPQAFHSLCEVTRKACCCMHHVIPVGFVQDVSFRLLRTIRNYRNFPKSH